MSGQNESGSAKLGGTNSAHYQRLKEPRVPVWLAVMIAALLVAAAVVAFRALRT